MTAEISILLATYNPNILWLEELLDSLNAQDYAGGMVLNVIDDCSSKITKEDLDAILGRHITAFPFTLDRNSENYGSTKTFERLTMVAGGEYIAYCDQDDIWERTKLHKSVGVLKRSGAAFVCGDVTVIDANGAVTHNSITELHPRHVFYDGEGLADRLLLRNFAIGCTILIKTEVAKAAMPFIDGMVHDHWLAIFAASQGRIGVLREPLLRYRVHGTNQTGTLAGITTKGEYYERRIYPFLTQMTEITHRLDLGKIGEEALLFAVARVGYYNRNLPHAGGLMWKCRQLDKKVTLFELAMRLMPRFVFKKILKYFQKHG